MVSSLSDSQSVALPGGRDKPCKPPSLAALDYWYLTKYPKGMQDQMANVTDIPKSRAENFRTNLRRIFDAGTTQQEVAKNAGVHFVHLNNILSGKAQNPTIGTIEALAIAVEVPVETLLSANPSDVDLRIFRKNREETTKRG